MSDSCLIDTNILVYAYDPSSAKKHSTALQVLDALAGTDAAVLSTQVLSEFYSVATRKLKPALTASEAEERLHRLSRTWPVVPVTPLIVLEAARGARTFKLSFWDALIWATARLNQVPVVLSEDFSDGQSLDGVFFRNPFSAKFDIARLR